MAKDYLTLRHTHDIVYDGYQEFKLNPYTCLANIHDLRPA